MKKILSLAVLLVAFCASADDVNDQYLYFMIGENATVGSQSLDKGGNYYAMVKLDGASTYLNFYDTVGGASQGSVFNLDLADSMPVFAGVFANDPTKSFIVELYAAGAGTDNTMLGQALLEWNSSYIASNGMGHSDYAAVNAFTAVPEPTSGLLLLLGMAGLALRRKKMQKA